MTGRAELSKYVFSQVVLVHIADQLGVPSLSFASLQSPYRDGSTLFRHRKQAVELAGSGEAGAGALSRLL